MPKISLESRNIFYTDNGFPDSDCLLLIAGFASDTNTWALMMSELSKTYRVIRLDNCGVGQSSGLHGPYSIQQMATDAAAVLTHLGINRAHVVGHSMGGQIAQELTLLQPQTVKSLTLISTWAVPDAKFQALMQFLGELPHKLDLTDYLQSLMHWSFGERFFAKPEIIAEIQLAIANNSYPPSPESLFWQSQAIIQANTGSRLGQISCPTLILHGDQDLITPLKFAQQLKAGIPQAQVVILPNTAHGAVIEAAAEVIQALLTFLENLEALRT